MDTLQVWADAIAERHPERAFFVYVYSGPGPNNIHTHQLASSQLHDTFSLPGWVQYVGQQVSTVPVQLPNAGTQRPRADRTCQPSEQKMGSHQKLVWTLTEPRSAS